MNTITFFVAGEPRPKQSFRYSSKGGGYTEPRIKAWQDTVSIEARKYAKELLGGDITVHMTFFLGNKRRVDLDNLSKAVLDACNGILWTDDQQVKHLSLDKVVASKEREIGVFMVVHDEN